MIGHLRPFTARSGIFLFFHNVQTRSVVHTVSYLMGTEDFLSALQRIRRGTDESSSSSIVEVQEWLEPHLHKKYLDYFRQQCQFFTFSQTGFRWRPAAESISVQFRNLCLNNFANRQTKNRTEPCILHDPQTFKFRAKSDSFLPRSI